MSDNLQLEIITKARILIDEKGWTKNALARDRYGELTYYYPDAVCFCTTGAIAAASQSIRERNTGQNVSIAEMNIYAKARDLIGGSIASYNDAEVRTKEDILQLFDRMIERYKDA